MDWFNRKKVGYLEGKLKFLSEKEGYANRVIKHLVEEPDSIISQEILRILKDRFSKRMWNGLTKSYHLGYLINEEQDKDEAKEITKYL